MQKQISDYRLIRLDSCTFAITSASPVVITWDAVKTALQTLIALCIMNPISSSAGGRAYSGFGGGITGRSVDGKISLEPITSRVHLYFITRSISKLGIQL